MYAFIGYFNRHACMVVKCFYGNILVHFSIQMLIMLW